MASFINVLDDTPNDFVNVLELEPAGKARGEVRGETGKAAGKPMPAPKKTWLQELGEQAEAATNFIPVAAGGALQGFALPFQGAASLLPGEVAENFAKEDFTRFFPKPRNKDEEILQTASEFGGSLGPLGKLFGLLKGGAQAASVPKALQNASALAGTGAIATPGDAFDKTLGASGALALGGAGKVASKVGEKVPAFMRGLLNESTEKAVIDAIQKPHDVLSNTADQLYNYVRSSIGERKINIPINKDYIRQARLILPDTRANQKLLQDAKTGNYDAIHDLQSHLYKKGTKGLASDDIGIEKQGAEIIELRDKINEDLNNYLMQSGNSDIAHVLQQGRNTHRKLMQTYFNADLPKGIHKLVQSNLRQEPKNLANLFSVKSDPMKRFLKDHPDVMKNITGLQEKEAAKKALSKILWGTAGTGIAVSSGKTLYDLLK